jgi:lipopolysaccharide transport system ATP-binding protein
MSDIAIRVENLGKCYRIGVHEKQAKTWRESLRNLLGSPLGYLRSTLRGPSVEETLWALKNVSFEVQEGEVLGIIGRNGAGKSTLLKVLSRITDPTEGHATVNGRVGSLLEVGTGFHPELTGRENIYMNGAILGMSRAEIKRKFDEIVDFSGMEKFIDTPVKRYSSGMYVRLAFAVAAHLEPEILLVDEVLAVGDAAFQKKCLGKMGEVAGGGRTILLVSHNMEAITSLCSRAIWLDFGSKKAEGPADQVVRQYLAACRELGKWPTALAERNDRTGNGQLRFTGFRLRDERGDPITFVGTGDTVDFVLSYVVPAGGPVYNVTVWFQLLDAFQRNLLFFWSNLKEEDFECLPPEGELVCQVPRFPLVPGTYSVTLGASVEGISADKIADAATLEVVTSDFFGTGKKPKRGTAVFLCDYSWRFDENNP